MSKKSGFFYVMATLISNLFIYHRSPEPQFQPERKVQRSSGGREITNYGKKPAYMKDKVLYQDRGNIIYVSVGHLYWRTRALAEANR
jgi:hypothetical protein